MHPKAFELFISSLKIRLHMNSSVFFINSFDPPSFHFLICANYLFKNEINPSSG